MFLWLVGLKKERKKRGKKLHLNRLNYLPFYLCLTLLHYLKLRTRVRAHTDANTHTHTHTHTRTHARTHARICSSAVLYRVTFEAKDNLWTVYSATSTSHIRCRKLEKSEGKGRGKAESK